MRQKEDRVMAGEREGRKKEKWRWRRGGEERR